MFQRLSLALLLVLIALPAAAQSDAWSGTWQLDADRSTAIDPWRQFTVVTDVVPSGVVLKRMWRGSREGGSYVDSVLVHPGGAPSAVRMTQWPDNRHLGAYIGGDSLRTVVARWADGGRTLVTESTLTLSTQQGDRPVRIYTEYRLSPGGDRLDVFELRSTRPSPLHYLLRRADS